MNTRTNEAHTAMTAFTLCEEVERFISSNSYSRDLGNRWLADFLKTILPVIREVRNNNLSPETREKVTKFRALEIEEELRNKRSEIEILERDLRKVKGS